MAGVVMMVCLTMWHAPVVAHQNSKQVFGRRLYLFSLQSSTCLDWTWFRSLCSLHCCCAVVH